MRRPRHLQYFPQSVMYSGFHQTQRSLCRYHRRHPHPHRMRKECK